MGQAFLHRHSAQHIGHGVRRFPLGGGGEGVAEVVEADVGQACSVQHPMEHMQDAVRGHGTAGGGGEYPWAVSCLFPLLL